MGLGPQAGNRLQAFIINFIFIFLIITKRAFNWELPLFAVQFISMGLVQVRNGLSACSSSIHLKLN
jgi:hypothetical protein